MDIVPFEFKSVPPPPPDTYQVTFYCFFDGHRVHHFAHQSEMLDNAALARECGVSVHTFNMCVFVTASRFPEIFNQIKDYVSRANLD